MEKVIYERLYPSDGKKGIINFTITGEGKEGGGRCEGIQIMIWPELDKNYTKNWITKLLY